MIQSGPDDTKTDEARRLTQARIDRGFADAKAAADYFGWNYTTYSQHERGERGLRKAVAEKYATAFRVSPAWLMTGEGEDEAVYSVMVMGKIGAGSSILPEYEQVPEHGLYEVETLFPVPADAIAFEVEGDSMWPRYDPGDIIVCWRQGSNIEEVVGWEAAVRTEDGHRYLKRILCGAERGTFDLESHNAPPIRGVRLEWVAQIGAVVRADMWKRATPKQKSAMEKRLAGAMAR